MSFASLHVRVTNKAAIHVYTQILEYDIHDVEEKYYADSENAFDMRKYFKKKEGKDKDKKDHQQNQQTSANGVTPSNKENG